MARSDVAPAAGSSGIARLVDAVQSMGDLQLAYSLFRITLGMNIFFHGAMRIYTGLDAWVVMQAAVFIPPKSPLPVWSVHAFLYVLPFVEVVLGTLTFLGLYTRWALIGGSVMMLILVFGNDMRQDWGTVGNNMHYVLYYVLMIAALKYNAFALDTRKAARN
jgi:thiosulfate dehydrogenase [quinone] large subunit